MEGVLCLDIPEAQPHVSTGPAALFGFTSLLVVLCIMQCRHSCLSLSLFAEYFRSVFVNLPHIDITHLEPREPEIPISRGLKWGS